MGSKLYYTSFIACFFVLNGFAQKQNVYFLKNDGRYVDKKDSADFIRIVREPDSNVRILRSIDPEIDAEAIRVLQESPKWNPGLQHGVPVRVAYTMPINFNLGR